MTEIHDKHKETRYNSQNINNNGRGREAETAAGKVAFDKLL